MDRREFLATGGVSLVAIAGCLGTYEVAQRTVIPSDDSTDATDDSEEDESGEDPLSGEDGPLADSGENNETEENGDELVESDDSDEGETDDNEESAETSEGRLEDPNEELTWLERGTETFEEPGYEGGERVVVGEIRNDTGHDLSYLLIGAQGWLDDELVTENAIEVAGLPAGETLTFEIPLHVEPDEMDEFQLGVIEAYVDSDD